MKERQRRRTKDPEWRRKRRIQAMLDYARRRGFSIVEEVDFDIVFERDNGMCQICHEPVDLALPRSASQPMSATIHHLEPVHSYATVQLAHNLCNNKERS